ncbi:MAG TPA: hypothetical protein VFZ57_02720, partial [Thermoanaerobaculia bacterium]|nr:hypothetical protein [Thermoanaerobaculia bacterium]
MNSDISGADSAVPGRDRPGDVRITRAADSWSPRRSLAARLLWYVVPVALVPAAIYWVAGDRIGAEQQNTILSTLLVDARRQEKQTLADQAADRVRQIGDAKREVMDIARRAAAESSTALEAGPDAKLPAERLVDEAGGLLRTSGHGVSVAMVSRRRPFAGEARRDLAATRRLEA